MFCPQCNAEYRPGFTRCVDCDVELVSEPPHYALAGQPSADPGDPNEDPFCSFWKGEDARVHAELCEVLEEAGIPHKTVFRRDHLFNLTNYPGYEVGVPFSLFEKAEKAVQEAFGTEGAEEQETPFDDDSGAGRKYSWPANGRRRGGLVPGRRDRECLVHGRGRAQRLPGRRSPRKRDQLPRGPARAACESLRPAR